MAQKYGVDGNNLKNWLTYLGVGAAPAQIDGVFTEKITNVGGYEFVNGWGTERHAARDRQFIGHVCPRSGQHAAARRVHSSITDATRRGRMAQPATATLRIDANVAVAHPECTNGVTWTIELRRGTTRQQLASGIANQQQAGKAAIENIAIRAW